MSSEPTPPDLSATDGAPASGGSHAGSVVRAAREARGQTLLHLSILLKISERRLQAFEEGRWDDVGDRTFVRALAQSLCKHLELAPQPVLQSLPVVQTQPHAQPDRGRLSASAAPSLKSLRRPVQMPGGGGTGVFTPVRLGVAVILAGALGLAFAPTEWWASAPQPDVQVAAPLSGAAAPSATDAPAAEAPGVAQPAASEPAAAAVSGSTAPSQPAPSAGSAPAGSATVPAVAPNATVVANVANSPNAAAKAPPATPAPAGPAVGDTAASPLQLRATADTWVQVTDAKGAVVFSRLLRNGERVGLEGVRPLRIRVGNVAGTEVVWQGRRVALEDTQRNNVADVELP